MTSAPTWVVLGAGYTGERLASALRARGDAVIATRRTAEAAAEVARRTGATAAVVDFAEPTTLGALAPAGATWVVTAPPDPLGAEAGAVAAAAARCAARRIVYLSTTGVYAPAHGAWVDENVPAAPASDAGRARHLAEATLAAGPIPCVRLRVAGIYGPGRGVVARLRAGTYRLIGDGAPWVSRVHVDDLVAAVVAAGDAASPGPIYNVADRHPCPSRQLVDEACAALGLPRPPTVALAAAPPEAVAMVTADRRIDSARLARELGWTLRYPSWREALAAGAC